MPPKHNHEVVAVIKNGGLEIRLNSDCPFCRAIEKKLKKSQPKKRKGRR